MNRRGFFGRVFGLAGGAAAAAATANAPATGGIVRGPIPAMLPQPIIVDRTVFCELDGRRIAEVILPHLSGAIRRSGLS